MLYIDSITSDAFQNFTLTGIPGVQVGILLSYRPRVQQWYMDVTWNTFTANGLAVVCSPNLMRQWKNILPFGLACAGTNELDPYLLTDFENQVQSIYLLDSADVAAVESAYYS